MGLPNILYDMIATVAALGATALGVRRRTGPRRWEWMRERFGRIDYGPKDLWLHAVSVGETVAAVPLVRELNLRHPDWRLLFTTVTETGREVARRHLPHGRIATIPWDIGPIVGKVLRETGPRAVITLETEIWPAFIHAARRRKIPFLIVNGRISDRSFKRYHTARGLMSGVFGGIDGFGMQTEEDASRVVALGADPAAVAVLGNLKYDVPVPAGGVPGWMRRMGGKVWVVGSTHKGEDEMILEAFKRARGRIPELQLVLAPRHPERFDAVARLVEAGGLPLARRSSLGDDAGAGPVSVPVVLLDVMGELPRVYGGATACFVGGSLVAAGGHNVLEAVVWERPVIVGPHMDNFAEMTKVLDAVGGLRRVRDGRELSEVLLLFLTDEGAAASQAERAASVLEQHRGAAKRTADWIESRVVADSDSV